MPYKDKEKRKQAARRHRLKVRKITDDYKLERGCKLCGYNKHPAALHFHHREDEEKLFEIADWRSRVHAIDTLLIEMNKCDVNCANCHAEQHSSKSTWDTKKYKYREERNGRSNQRSARV